MPVSRPLPRHDNSYPFYLFGRPRRKADFRSPLFETIVSLYERNGQYTLEFPLSIAVWSLPNSIYSRTSSTSLGTYGSWLAPQYPPLPYRPRELEGTGMSQKSGSWHLVRQYDSKDHTRQCEGSYRCADKNIGGTPSTVANAFSGLIIICGPLKRSNTY
jgi:hypothetical protein